MKKLLLILLCVPLMFSCGENNEENKDKGSLSKEITEEMLDDGYTGKGTYTDSTGAEYIGEFKGGRMHGQGRFTYENVILEGLWEHNNFLGLKQTVIIQDGEKGVLFKYYDGLEKETIYESGKHTIASQDNMIIYDVKTQTLAITVNGKDSNAVQVGLEMHILYNPIPDKIGYLANEIGKNYVNKVIKPEISDITLTTLKSYTYDEITSFDEMISEKKDELEDIIEKRMKEELFSYHINIENIFIKNVIISQNIIDAINRKKKKEEELKKMRYID